MAERISQEVIMVLSREQRVSQPLGIVVGSPSAPSEGTLLLLIPIKAPTTILTKRNVDVERDQLANAAATAARPIGSKYR